jgi:hypothetical protein
MGVFVDYLPKRFSGLKDVETTLLTANTHPIIVLSLRVTNRTSDKILVNLKNTRNDGITTITYEDNQFPFEPYERRDLIKECGEFHLEYKDVPSISESLAIYSNGYTQIFDCNISYITLNDLPVPVPPPPTE